MMTGIRGACLLLVAGLVLLLTPILMAGQRTGLVPGQGPTMNMPGTSGCPDEPALLYPCALAKAKVFNPPRTADGKPDFQGYWDRAGKVNSFNLQDPKNTVLVNPPGKIPYQPWAEARHPEYVATYIDQVSRCLPGGVPRHFLEPAEYRMVQTPGYIVFMEEHVHQSRIVPTDGRPHIDPKIRLWMGDSVGHWEGNTLVIDTTNLNGLAFLDLDRNFASDALHVVERYTLIDANNILIEAILDDPTVFTRPITLAWARTRDPRQVKGLELLEEACVEGNGRWLEGELIQGRKIFMSPARK